MGNNKESDSHVSGKANNLLFLPSHALSYHTVLHELAANADDGLAIAGADAPLEEYGRNECDDVPGLQLVNILVRQVTNPMMLVKPPYYRFVSKSLIQKCRS